MVSVASEGASASASLSRSLLLHAVVRIADELVDGTATQAHTDPAAALDAYEQTILAAPRQRLHTDPIVHAYAITARRCGFHREYLAAFFNSMRADLTQREYSPSECTRAIRSRLPPR